ncbi:hypothetical protein FGG08_007188 [Glutinoglossum americanum]|uniref:Uncharacterized protein n=1 Tax=Glutinoglossum americanum TaxID=1670608 RepID=A0A9P8HWT6_9PEZI|nr:hypothetical protein FGG08_007188 [Glutinoglossum americanum]
MPRLIRRESLSSRLKNYLNPLDFLLYLSEQVEGAEWEEYQRAVALPVGVGCNLLFLVARANTGAGGGWGEDDVFGDAGGEGGAGGGVGGWLGWLASFVVHFLTLVCLLNTLYTVHRKRRYRLFETSIDHPPHTPSAHRVRVDSSPLSSSPLRFFSTLLDPLISSSSAAADSRSHPSASRDVWEIAVWDPTALCLQLFCFFSPGHVLIYYLLLPPTATDPRPSTTILTAILFATLLTCQLLWLLRALSQQAKDHALIHKEVLHEYDAKFVHPRLNPTVRDVATQFNADERAPLGGRGDVQLYAPATVIKREFYTRPNPNYAQHTDPDFRPPRPSMSTASSFRPTTPFHARQAYAGTPIPQPQFRPATTAGGGGGGSGDGGSLGVYSHANSPLKKSASSGFLGKEREGSPVKRRGGGGRYSGVGVGVGGDITGGRRESGRF